MTSGFVVGLLVGLIVVLFAALWYALVIRRRHGGGPPLPAFLIRAETPSPALRDLVARVARSVVKDYMTEWSTVPPALKTAIRQELLRASAQAWAAHDGRTRRNHQ